MKKFYVTILSTVTMVNVQAQCATSTLIGSATNMFTHIRNSTNPVAADRNLNTIVFAHRNNSGIFGGNSGQLRYDVSTNAGATWSLDIGVLNPLTTNLGRYPNVTIYNPSLNINPASAYVAYMAATISSVSSAWNGLVTGATALGTAAGTENYNQPAPPPQLIPHSVVKGAPGVFWAADILYNGTYNGFVIYKGVWSNGASDIVWNTNYTVTPPFNTNYSSSAMVADYNIAFDPTGMKGWFSFLGHVNPGPSGYAYYPVFYKTVDGGVTWTGPIQVNLTGLSCLTANMASGNIVTTNFEHDLTVDVNGDPHLFTTICNGTNAYSVLYGQWHHMYDITLSDGLWVAYDVSNVLAGRATWGTAPNSASQDMSPQAARSADGTKVFFTWADNTNYTLGNANALPNLFGRAYNVVSKNWTPVKDFTSCNSVTQNKILFPHLAPEVLEPSSGVFKLAPVYAEFQSPSSDPALPSNFKFLDNVTFAASEFSISQPSGTVTITQASPLLICPGSTLVVTLNGSPGQALWSTGAITTTLGVSQSSVTTYTVLAQVGCLTGTASISVMNMSISAAGSSPSACIGNTVDLTVTGNAFSYTWLPGNSSGTTITATLSTVPVYTVMGQGSGGCTGVSTVSVTILPLPTITVAGNGTICLGGVSTQTASGASSYAWSNASSGPTATFSPVSNTNYTVTGTDANSCVNTQTVSVFVNPLPTVTASSDKTVICIGETVALNGSGAQSYLWSTGSTVQITTVTPTQSGSYTLTGTDANSCTNTAVVNVTVNPLPTLTVTSTRTLACKGEKTFTMTVAGAQNYTWTGGPTSATFATNITATKVFTITGASGSGCVNSTTFSVAYSECTGLDAKYSNRLQLYPNPGNGEFYIDVAFTHGEYIIYDITGRKVGAGHLVHGTNYVDLTLEPAGIYIMEAVTEGEKTVVKLVKQ
jgi:hypothetical protein